MERAECDKWLKQTKETKLIVLTIPMISSELSVYALVECHYCSCDVQGIRERLKTHIHRKIVRLKLLKTMFLKWLEIQNKTKL